MKKTPLLKKAQGPILLFIVLFAQFACAQTSLNWKPLESNPQIIRQQHGWCPIEYASFSLDPNACLQILSAAPDFTDQQALPFVVEFPMPDGTFEPFSIVEMSVMEPELQAKFPDFKTYSGRSLLHPTWSIKCDITALGFHGFIQNDLGTVYIDPYSLSNTMDYLVYYKHRSGRTPSMVCELDESLSAQSYVQPSLPGAFGKSTSAQLRTYRLAVAATGEYTAFFGGTVALGMAAITTSVNRVNGIYEKEVAARLVLVANNNLLVYTDAATDPYTNSSGSTMLGQNQTNITSIIGSANYDIGHVFSTGGGGVAGLGVVCSSTNKARGVTGQSAPVGDPFDVDYVAHEMGHQFAGNHTFNSATGNCTSNRAASAAYEPGSGITIQAYAGICGSDNLALNSIDVFHTKSFDEIYNFTTTGSGNACAAITANGNTAPVLDSLTGEKSIPFNTAFKLKAYGTDPNGDPITYSWEQYDLGPAGAWNAPSGNAPIFTSILPTSSGERIFPKLSNILSNTVSPGEIYPTYARDLNFRVTLRDSKLGGGGVTHNDNPVIIHVINTTDTFKITYPNTSGISFTQNTCPTIKWKVAGTTASPISTANVNIRLSVDNGLTFPHLLIANTPNDGSQTVSLPAGVTSTTARIMVESVGNIFFDINDQPFTITNTLVVTGITSPNTSCAAPNGTVDIAGKCTGTPFMYLWSNGATSEDLVGVPAGTYTVTVNNGAGSTASGVFTVGSAVVGTVGVSASAIAASCGNTADGSALALNIGGVAPFTYSWSNGQSGQVANNLVPATYTVTISDANNCTATSSTQVTTAFSVTAPVTTAFSICQDATVPPGQGISAAATSIGPITKLSRFPGSPYSSNGPLFTAASFTFPPLPAGAVISSAQLKLFNVNALGSSLRSEIRVSLSGAFTLAATQLSTLTSAGVISPAPVITLSSFPVSGGVVNLLFSETTDNTGVDASIDSARIDITYTVPTTIAWWTSASGGSQLSTTPTFNPVGSASLPNTNTAGVYPFYAESRVGNCTSATRSTANFNVLVKPVPVISGNLIFCSGSSTTLSTTLSYPTYLWSNGASTATISVSNAATYSVTVTGSNGCTAVSPSVTTTLNSAPSITCPSSIVTPLLSGCSRVINYSASSTGQPTPTLTYSMSGATTGSGSGSGSGTSFQRGVTMVTLTAVNSCGSSTCNFSVTVNDELAPMINCPFNISNCNSIVNFNAVATDNCGLASISYSHTPGSLFPIGVTTVTVTATDSSSNTASCTFNVEISAPSAFSSSVTSCDSYTWTANNNTTYTLSGSYTATFVNTAGCDSVHTLNIYIPGGVQISIKALLSGPYVSSTGWMHDSLRVANMIPLAEPYSASPYNVTPIGGVGGETIQASVLNVSGANAIVDWVLIEIRDAFNPSMILANKRALIQRDGDIVDVDGVSLPFISSISQGSYYVSIKHRNHLGVMTMQTKSLSACNSNLIDFSSQAPVYSNPLISNAPRKSVDNMMALWAGDANRNKQVKYNGNNNDKDRILIAIGVSMPNSTLAPVYRLEDLNMDAKVRYNNVDNDRVIILNNVGATTPNTILFQHTPN